MLVDMTKFPCSYCKGKILRNSDATMCPHCHVVMHKSCWEANKGCTTPGCKGRFNSGAIAKTEAEKHTAKSTSSLYENVGYTGSVASQIALAKDLGTDLLEMSYHDDCCPECAKYQGRVYSISGKDPRFPQLPKQVLLTGAIHPGCRHNFSAYNYYPGAELSFSVIDNSEKGYHIEYVDAIKYSNRPFVDDRTEEERNHGKYVKMKKDFDAIMGNASNLYSMQDYAAAERAYLDATVMYAMLIPLWEKYNQRLPYGESPYKRIAMIREKRGDYEGAALACVQQLRLGVQGDGTKGGMRGRLARMVKKGNLAETCPEAMKEITQYLEIK